MAEKKRIRDFIYLDGDKLYSLYSQVNDGIAQQIVQSRLKGKQETKTQKGDILEGGAIEDQISDVIHSTENKVLHDYMYARLEEQIKDSITEPVDVTPENYRKKFLDTFLIKVKGNAEICDYARLRDIFTNVNEMAEGISYMQEFAKIEMPIYKAKSLINSMKNKAEQPGLLKYIKKFENPKELAKETGLLQDEKQMHYFGFFTKLFYLGEIEVIIKAKYSEENTIDVRGLLNQDWLRIKPEPLRMLYGGLTDFEWTMVAQVTYIQNPNETEPNLFQSNPESDGNQTDAQKQKEIEDALTKTGEEGLKKPDTMRDSLLKMVRATRQLENTFMSSGAITEIIVSPLAIYRETEVKISP